jgi:streptomycin 3"-adenylyltransferase
VTPAVEGYLAALVRILGERLGEGFVGAYLHGSAVLGGWRQDRSDVDVLAVCAAPVADAGALEELAGALSVRSLPCPAPRGLELGLMTAESAASAGAEPAFELDLTTSAAGDTPTLGRGRGHADYLMHIAVCRRHGQALAGPQPEEVFADVPARLLDATFAGELAWAAAHAPATYQVLNACRAWRFATDRELCSKVAGGEWALGRGADDAAIAAALEIQRGGPERPIDPAPVAALIARVTAELGGAARYPPA